MPKPKDSAARASARGRKLSRSEKERQFQIGCFSLKPPALYFRRLRAKTFNLLIGSIWPVVCTFAGVSSLLMSLGQLGVEMPLMDLLRPESGSNRTTEFAQTPESMQGEWLEMLGQAENGIQVPDDLPEPERVPAPRKRPRPPEHTPAPSVVLMHPALTTVPRDFGALEAQFLLGPATEPAPLQEQGLEMEMEIEAPSVGIEVASKINHPDGAHLARVVEEAQDPPARMSEELSAKSPDIEGESMPEHPERHGESSLEEPRVQSDQAVQRPLQPLPESPVSPIVPSHREQPQATANERRGEKIHHHLSAQQPQVARPNGEPLKHMAPVLGLRIWRQPEQSEKSEVPPEVPREPAGQSPLIKTISGRESLQPCSSELMPKPVTSPLAKEFAPVTEADPGPREEIPPLAVHQNDVAPEHQGAQEPRSPEATPSPSRSEPVDIQPRADTLSRSPEPARLERAEPTTAKVAERPSPAQPVEDRKQQTIVQPAIKVRLDVPESEPVHVQFVQRAGEVHVLVRSNEPGASARLASGIEELAQDLSTGGAKTESWAGGEGPDGLVSSNERTEWQREESVARPSATAEGTSADSREQSAGERRNHRPLPEWLEMLSEREDEAALRRFRRLGEKGTPTWRQ